MKTRTRIGAMILVLALLCAVPVGGETETLTVIDTSLANHLKNDAPEEILDVVIWLPQADWGVGESLPQYKGKIVSNITILDFRYEYGLYEFFDKERDSSTLAVISDRTWFEKEYGVSLDGPTSFGGNYWATMSIDEINLLISKNPDAFLGMVPPSGIERPMGPKGDADENVKVDSSDARLVLQYAVGKTTNARFISKYNADFDSNGVIDSADARQILQKAVGKL